MVDSRFVDPATGNERLPIGESRYREALTAVTPKKISDGHIYTFATVAHDQPTFESSDQPTKELPRIS